MGGREEVDLRVICLIRIVSSWTVVGFPSHHDENEEEEGKKDHSHVKMPPTTITL